MTAFPLPTNVLFVDDDYCIGDLPPPVVAIRYYLPVEAQKNGAPSGLFRFCCFVYPVGVVLPVGHCAENCAGHRSKEAARHHYREYLLDRFLQFGGLLSSQSLCSVCGGPTRHYAWIDFHYDWKIVPLCGLHMNRHSFERSFVLSDYHLLQISKSHLEPVATFAEVNGPVSIVLPRTRPHNELGK